MLIRLKKCNAKRAQISILFNIIFFFLFFTLRYYFSDDNYKKSYRAVSSIDEKISSNENNLFILKNDTDNIIEYVEYKNKNTKKYSFWELLYND